MNIYPVGTIVRVRDDLEVGKCYGDITSQCDVELIDSMKGWLGREAVITDNSAAKYGCYILDGLFWWNEEMFEAVSPNVKADPKEGDRNGGDREFSYRETVTQD